MPGPFRSAFDKNLGPAHDKLKGPLEKARCAWKEHVDLAVVHISTIEDEDEREAAIEAEAETVLEASGPTRATKVVRDRFDQEVAKVVFTPSVLGDYVVTPAQVTGQEPLEFFGRDPDYDSRTVDVAAASDVEPDFESDGW